MNKVYPVKEKCRHFTAAALFAAAAALSAALFTTSAGAAGNEYTVDIKKDSAMLFAGDTMTLEYSVKNGSSAASLSNLPEGYSVVWTSSDSTNLSVDSTGKLTADPAFEFNSSGDVSLKRPIPSDDINVTVELRDANGKTISKDTASVYVINAYLSKTSLTTIRGDETLDAYRGDLSLYVLRGGTTAFDRFDELSWSSSDETIAKISTIETEGSGTKRMPSIGTYMERRSYITFTRANIGETEINVNTSDGDNGLTLDLNIAELVIYGNPCSDYIEDTTDGITYDPENNTVTLDLAEACDDDNDTSNDSTTFINYYPEKEKTLNVEIVGDNTIEEGSMTSTSAFIVSQGGSGVIIGGGGKIDLGSSNGTAITTDGEVIIKDGTTIKTETGANITTAINVGRLYLKNGFLELTSTNGMDVCVNWDSEDEPAFEMEYGSITGTAGNYQGTTWNKYCALGGYSKQTISLEGLVIDTPIEAELYTLEDGCFGITGKKSTGKDYTQPKKILSSDSKPLILYGSDEIYIHNISPTELSIDKEKLYLTPNGESSQLSAVILPADSDTKNASWISGDSSVATVDQNGVVTPKNEGSTTITALIKSAYGTLSASCKVVVTDNPVTEVNIEMPEAQIVEGDSFVLNAAAVPSDAFDTTIYWSSSDENIVSVDENGNLTGIQPGTATVTATSDNGKTASCSVTVRAKTEIHKVLAGGTEENITDAALFAGDTMTVKAVVNIAGEEKGTVVSDENIGNSDLTWAAEDDSLIAFDIETGKVTALRSSTAATKLAAAYTDESGEHIAAISFTLVNAVLNRNTADTYEGGSVRLTGTVTPASLKDSVEYFWTSSDEEIARVNKGTYKLTGLIDGLNKGTAVITLNTKDGENGITCQINVKDTDGVKIDLDKNDFVILNGDSTTLAYEVYREIAAEQEEDETDSGEASGDESTDTSQNETDPEPGSDPEDAAGTAALIEETGPEETAITELTEEAAFIQEDSMEGESGPDGSSEDPDGDTEDEKTADPERETVDPYDLGLTISWEIDNSVTDVSDIISVDNKGNVTGLSPKTSSYASVIVYLKDSNGNVISQDKAQILVVKAQFDPESLTTEPGNEENVKLKITADADMLEEILPQLIWTSADENIASVATIEGSENTATVKALANGQTEINVNTADGTKGISLALTAAEPTPSATVTPTPTSVITETPTSTPVVTEEPTITLTVTPTATVTVTVTPAAEIFIILMLSALGIAVLVINKVRKA